MPALSSAPSVVQTFSSLSISASLSQPSIPASRALFSTKSPCTLSSHRLSRTHLYPAVPLPENGGRLHGRRRFQAFAVQAAGKREKWLLVPVGDGDSSHIGEAVPLPGAFEIFTDAVTVGRVPDRADIVIPVATVSGLHARLEKKDGALFVTDLDSTNGTYIDEKRIRPGSVTLVIPGSRVTFGDEHLAAFQFSKVEDTAPSAENGESA